MKSSVKLPPSAPAYFEDEDKIVDWLSQLTGQSPKFVLSRLLKEYDKPGINVSDAVRQYEIEPYKWTDKLADFYSRTDAFLYELILWNLNKRKRRMRRRIGKYLYKNVGQNLDILTVGDGLGVDSVYFTRAGHRVTYFETSAYNLAFAKMLLADYAKDVKILDDLNLIPKNAFDVVICLDVLEHVPDPHEFVKNIAGYLKPDGRLIVHAPFYQIHKSTPTHLKSNRKYSGSLSLYENQGLTLVGGALTWDPITLIKKSNSRNGYHTFKLRPLAIRLAGLYLKLGRFTILPFRWIGSYRLKGRRWFKG
ncbi:MAG: class I SAM-dependent methyltransferase [Sedimentisphaerales bacterium]|nr:class I SAM-dependent methyltransferase [Sedimentisphaerales bacterium]